MVVSEWERGGRGFRMGSDESSDRKNVSYDDYAFFTFAVAVMSVVVVPVTIIRLVRFVTGGEAKKEKERLKQFCTCRNCQKKAQRLMTEKKVERLGRAL